MIGESQSASSVQLRKDHETVRKLTPSLCAGTVAACRRLQKCNPGVSVYWVPPPQNALHASLKESLQ